MADNLTHTFFYSALASSTAASIDSSRTNVYNPTDVNTSRVSSPTSTTDVVVYDTDYTDYCGLGWDGSPNIVGHVRCVSRNSANECEKHEMRYDAPDMASYTSAKRNHFTCHETGHSLGLAHRESSPNGCMSQVDRTTTDITTHDEGHLNGDIRASSTDLDDVE